MNREALAETDEARERVLLVALAQAAVRKGEESGTCRSLRELRLDWTPTAILLKVRQAGGIACHTAARAASSASWENGNWVTIDPVLKFRRSSTKRRQEMKAGLYETLERIAATIGSAQIRDPDKSYVARLLSQGEDSVRKKSAKTATETVLAAKSGEQAGIWCARPRICGSTAWFCSAPHGLGPGTCSPSCTAAKESRG